MMVITAGETAGTDDPRYQEGLAYLQNGEWQEAIHCLGELAREYPDSQSVQSALEQAQFKANLDATTRVRAKRWAIPWRMIVIRALIVAAIAFLAVHGVRLIQRQVAPALAQAQEQWRLTRLEAQGNALLEGGDLDGAEARFVQLLALAPDHQGALQGLDQIAQEREILDLYQQAVALREAGDYGAALQLFTEITIRRPHYRDVSLRIEDIRRQGDRDALFAQAEADYEAGRAAEAVFKYEQIRALDVNYQRDIVVQRLYTLYMQMGRELIQRNPPSSEGVPPALDYFVEALALEPRSTEAGLEKELAALYLEGQARYQEGRWDEAVASLRAVYDQRPDYLHGIVTNMLYDAYIGSGDQYRDADDLYLAYERYREAAALPVDDTVLARGRIYDIEPLLTPTATPTATSTPKPTPTATPRPTITPIPPTAEPTPTPTPIPLLAFGNQIVFRSDNEEEPGWWVMDPTGENRQYLGESQYYDEEYQALAALEPFSPDGRYRAFVTRVDGKTNIAIELPPHEKYGPQPPKELTRLTGLTYDPVWSPDGSRIAFVSQENGSDDIWVVYADGTGARSLTTNTWEWDKHASWSPDSERIVFWSNREGTKQIYVMDAGGQNLRKISNTEWDEYDPLWIK